MKFTTLSTVVGAALYLFLSGTSALAAEPTQVIIATVKMQSMHDRVEALGTLRANESVEITAAVTDTITAVNFTDGQAVRAGDILVEMTSAEEHAQREEELSRRDEARKQYERVAPLVERGAAARSLLDQRERELATAEARLLAIESRLADRLITAPFSGVVGLRNISPGALVEPGDPITTLDDTGVMKLDFTVPSVHLATLVPGTPIVAVTPAYPDERFKGTIASIDSRVDPLTRALLVRALLDNPEGRLKPGLLMSVEIRKNERQAVMVPEEALIPTGESNVVLVVVDTGTDPPVAERREVRIGGRRVGEVEILQGVQPGEQVITHGTLKVRPGQPVSILGEDTPETEVSRLLESSFTGGNQ